MTTKDNNLLDKLTQALKIDVRSPEYQHTIGLLDTPRYRDDEPDYLMCALCAAFSKDNGFNPIEIPEILAVSTAIMLREFVETRKEPTKSQMTNIANDLNIRFNRDDCFAILFENKQKVEDIIVGIDWISLLKK